MPIHNQTASTVNLAKSLLISIDRTKADTTIPTATYDLLLKTLVHLGDDQGGAGMKIAEAQSKEVSSRSAALNSAAKDRDK